MLFASVLPQGAKSGRSGVAICRRGKTKVCVVSSVRPCRDDDRTTILAIINAAAEAYRGVIPTDRWHEPRHAAKRARSQPRSHSGFIMRTMGHLQGLWACSRCTMSRSFGMPMSCRPMAAAISAASSTSEYKKHGFALVPPARKTVLLTTYWNIPDQADRAVGRPC